MREHLNGREAPWPLSVGMNRSLWYCLAGMHSERGPFVLGAQLCVWYDGSLPSPSWSAPACEGPAAARKWDEHGQSCTSLRKSMCGQTVGRLGGETHLRNRYRLGHPRSPNPPLNSSVLCGVVWRLNVQSGQCKRSVSLHQVGGGPATASIATGQSQTLKRCKDAVGCQRPA